MKISILGATGMIGGVVTKSLAEAGHQITALVRNPDAARSKLPTGVKAIAADVAERATLGTLNDADVVLFMLSVDPKRAKKSAFNPDRDGLKNVIEALSGGKRPHVMYLASKLQQANPHNWWVLSAKVEAARALQQSGLPHTILRPANLMESLPHRMLRGKAVGYMGAPVEPSRWIAAADFAAMLDAHLSRDLTQSYDITFQGPEALTVKQAAEAFAANYRVEKIKVSKAPLPMLKLIGAFVPELKYAANVSEAMNDAREPFDGEAEWQVLGKPKITVADYARSLTP